MGFKMVDYRKSEKRWRVQLFPLDRLFFKHLLSALVETKGHISLHFKDETHLFKSGAVSSRHEFLWHFK